MRAMRAAFVESQLELYAESLVFLDETWAGIVMSRMYGYAKAGEQAVVYRQLRGPRVSAIGAMIVNGPIGR